MLAPNLDRDGKLTVKSMAWKDPKKLLPGGRLEVMVVHGRWVIRKHPTKPPTPDGLRAWEL